MCSSCSPKSLGSEAKSEPKPDCLCLSLSPLPLRMALEHEWLLRSKTRSESPIGNRTLQGQSVCLVTWHFIKLLDRKPVARGVPGKHWASSQSHLLCVLIKDPGFGQGVHKNILYFQHPVCTDISSEKDWHLKYDSSIEYFFNISCFLITNQHYPE